MAQAPDLSAELKPSMEHVKASLHVLMKSAGVSFSSNSTVDSQTVRSAPEPNVPPFDRALEDFSQNCDSLLFELKQRRQALLLAQYSNVPCDAKMPYNQYKTIAKSHHSRVTELHGVLDRLRSEVGSGRKPGDQDKMGS